MLLQPQALVNLLANTASGGDAAGDTFLGIENLTGSAYADTLTGNTLDNMLSALALAPMLSTAATATIR